MSTFVNIYVLSFNFFLHLYILNFKFYEVVSPLYMKKYQVLSGCNPFFISAQYSFLQWGKSLFYSGEVFKIFLASFSLRSLFYGLQKLQILTASAPLQADFSRLPHGFLLASFSTSSRVQYCFSRASLVLRSHSSLTVNFCIFSLFALCSFFCSASVR